MPLLIDAYNLIHAGRNMGGIFARLSVRGLCQLLSQSAALRRQKITLVLDGRAKPDEPSENEFPHLNLVYSGTGISADRVISQLLGSKAAPNPARSRRQKNIVVITDDRAVQRDAREQSAKFQACDAFLLSLTGENGKGRRRDRGLTAEKFTGPASPGQTERWLKEFGFSSVINPRSMQNQPVKTKMDIDSIDPEEFLK